MSGAVKTFLAGARHSPQVIAALVFHFAAWRARLSHCNVLRRFGIPELRRFDLRRVGQRQAVDALDLRVSVEYDLDVSGVTFGVCAAKGRICARGEYDGFSSLHVTAQAVAFV